LNSTLGSKSLTPSTLKLGTSSSAPSPIEKISSQILITPPITKQTNIKKYGRVVTKEMQGKFQQLWSRYVFSSGVSFNSSENPALIEALKLAAPGVSIPTRKQLANDYLNSEYQLIKEEMKQIIQQQIKRDEDSIGICVTRDGWSNTRQESIVDYMICTPLEDPVFYSAKDTGANSHTSEYLKTDIISEMNSIESDTGADVVGVVSDNASNIKKALKDLQTQYPKKFFFHCFPHGLHLLIGDMLRSNEELQKIKEQAQTLVKFFRNHHCPNALFREKLMKQIRSDPKKTNFLFLV
jgi:hypothetical protein